MKTINIKWSDYSDNDLMIMYSIVKGGLIGAEKQGAPAVALKFPNDFMNELYLQMMVRDLKEQAEQMDQMLNQQHDIMTGNEQQDDR